ncbi:MAG: DUF4135 domain-containing protein [Bdellovibrionales bacterium]|nr:DUF4135 domain-containing protein [Bdellovibrionales bacterium]
MLMTMSQGDSHNFNRFVFEGVSGGTRVYVKPRPIFWELFFFGANSPLKTLFTKMTIKMELVHATEQSTHDNKVVAINSSKRPITPKDFYELGQLLGYCYYFGIQDIHKDNLLITNNGLQVVDVEQTFSDLLLPNQTLLLPTDKKLAWSAGLNALTQDPLELIPNTEAKALFDGYQSITEYFFNQLSGIRELLQAHESDFKNYPIRIFFRGTRDYANLLEKKTTIENLLPEENIQLERGDIPYFFKFINRNQVYYYTSESWEYKEVALPIDFIKYVDFCAKDPLDLFTNQRLENAWACGSLYLAKNLPTVPANKLKWETCAIDKTESYLSFTSKNLNMTTPL